MGHQCVGLYLSFIKGDKDFTDKEYHKYIRQAEYLLTLIHSKGEDISGIPGITFALSTCNKGENIIGLQSEVCNNQGYTRSGTYWANAGGILRQYYSSSLRNMAILKENINKISAMNVSKKEGPEPSLLG